MKTKLTILFTLIILSASAQSNWITNNFKTYFSNGKSSYYISESEKLLNTLSGSERSTSFHALTLFKVLSGYSRERMPICQFNIAANAVGLTINSKYLNSDVSLNYCNINGKYYYFLKNSLTNNGVSVNLKSKVRTSSGGTSISNVSTGAPIYSVAFFNSSFNFENYEIASYMKITNIETSPCL